LQRTAAFTETGESSDGDGDGDGDGTQEQLFIAGEAVGEVVGGGGNREGGNDSGDIVNSHGDEAVPGTDLGDQVDIQIAFIIDLLYGG
jgi:hypothetical protein